MCSIKYSDSTTGYIIAGSNKEHAMMLNVFSCRCVITITLTWATGINR